MRLVSVGPVLGGRPAPARDEEEAYPKQSRGVPAYVPPSRVGYKSPASDSVGAPGVRAHLPSVPTHEYLVWDPHTTPKIENLKRFRFTIVSSFL